MGHAADDMSRHYVQVPQLPLIEAIKLPVIPAWADVALMKDPLAHASKLAVPEKKSVPNPCQRKSKEV